MRMDKYFSFALRTVLFSFANRIEKGLKSVDWFLAFCEDLHSQRKLDISQKKLEMDRAEFTRACPVFSVKRTLKDYLAKVSPFARSRLN